jgi:type IV pilus assembly protein PilE
MRLRRGFTLVELMIVVLVLAIIASIAVPSYRSYVLRAQRSDATSALLRIRTAQEKFFLQNPQVGYTTEFGPAGLRMMPGATTTLTTENGYYNVSVTIPDPTPGATPQSFLITATPIAGGPQASDAKCTSFTLNSDGARGSAPSPIATCWK